MNLASGPILRTDHVKLSDLGISMQTISDAQAPTLVSDCLVLVDALAKINIFSLGQGGTITRVDTSGWHATYGADSAIIHPQHKYIALRHERALRVLEIQNDLILPPRLGNLHVTWEHVLFWKWISGSTIGFVTSNGVFNWSISTRRTSPNAVMNRDPTLRNARVVDYMVSSDSNWHALVCHRADARNVSGVIQLFNRERDTNHLIEGVAAAFLDVRVDGAPSLVKLLATAGKGDGTSDLRVVELEQPANPVFELKSLHIDVPRSTPGDYPLTVLPSNVDGIIYILTKYGLLHLYDIPAGKHLHTTKISQESILSAAELDPTGAVICTNSVGSIFSVSVDREALVSYVLATLHEEKLAMQLASRADLPGAEYLFFQHFQQCVLNGKSEEAATLAAKSPRGILRTGLVIEQLKGLPRCADGSAPILHFFTLLLERGRLNSFESAEAINLWQSGGRRLLEGWLEQDKLECSEELGDSMHEHDVSLALAIYKRAHIHHKAVKCLAEIGHSKDIQKYTRDVGFDPDHDVFPPMVNASAGGRGHVNASLEASRNLAFPTISLGEDDAERSTIKTVQESQDAQPRTWTDVKQLRTLDFPALQDALAGVATIEYLRVRGLALRGEDAAIFSDLLQQCLVSIPEADARRPELLRLLQDLCHASGELPSSYWLHDVTVNWRHPIARGGEALVYTGAYEGGKVVVRNLQPISGGWLSQLSQDTLALVRREIVTHAQLRHQNIIPLLGVFRETDDEPPMMILPFVENGSAVEFLKGATLGDIHDLTWKIIVGLVRALAYLHGRKPAVLHGDLHPDNVLVNAKGDAILCDFGFSRIRHEVTRTFTMIREGGRLRFLAPELSSGHSAFRTATSSDVYSLAMTFFNLITLSPPFLEYQSEMKAVHAAENGARPQRPGSHNLPPLTAGVMWELLEKMWDHVPENRPSASDVQMHMEGIMNTPV